MADLIGQSTGEDIAAFERDVLEDNNDTERSSSSAVDPSSPLPAIADVSESTEEFVGDYRGGTNKTQPILDESSLAPSIMSGASVASSKSRTSSLGKLFQKMRASEVLTRLKKEGGAGGTGSAEPVAASSANVGSGSGESGTTLGGVPKKLSAESTAQKSGTLKKYMGSWYSCWQKSAINGGDTSDADYMAYDEVHIGTGRGGGADDDDDETTKTEAAAPSASQMQLADDISLVEVPHSAAAV